jgi:hypothetical protein
MVGEEGKGLRYILSGMNTERILIASECIGDGKCGSSKKQPTIPTSASSSVAQSVRAKVFKSTDTHLCIFLSVSRLTPFRMFVYQCLRTKLQTG